MLGLRKATHSASISLGVALHPDTYTWQSRVIAAGGSISNSVLSATDTLVKWAYTNGLRDNTNTNHAIRFWLPLCTENFKGLFIPIWHPIANAVCTNNNFVAADYSRQTGLQGASTKYLGSGVLTTHLSSNSSVYLAVDSFTDSAEDAIAMGCANFLSGAIWYSSLTLRWSDGIAYFDHPNGSELSIAISSSLGFFQGIRDGNNAYIYRDTTQEATSVATPTANITAGVEYTLFASNGVGAGPSDFSTRRLQGFLFGSGGITAAMANSFATQYLAWKTIARA